MKIRTIMLASGAAVAVAMLAGCTTTTTMPGMGHEATPAPTRTISTTDATYNMADVMFVEMMIPHHEQAIEMSDLVLGKNGVDPAITALAQKIKDAQQPEINEMRGWLDAWGVGDQNGMTDGMGHGSGMMSDDDMTALDSADDADAGRIFLDQMIQHHEGAIDMAQSEVADGQDPDVLKLAQNIIASQTAEIEAMKVLLNVN
ncbi:DUF305 domain-containing protein [Herbiconiux ginsengi]|uniref:Uncharacterized conserved protein, DUF305 family n=1 Tax=Herbiconiux ginsengi TaxID=381665 RepID=A0A1H3SRD1_9MICO|nr:DUF305 domain-containing protein [Herbiconiux ginsengi]SDZ39679.1 Uncharacterized conserved protein, DUF305 family [Herbiconiux ginsengi]